MNDKTIKLIAGHEGFSTVAYLCTANHTTIGYGYNLDANPLKLPIEKIQSLRKFGIGEIEATKLLILVLEKIEHDLSGKLSWWSKLNLARQSVLLDMAYNLGVDGLMEFKKTLLTIGNGNYAKASEEMLKSKWAVQVKSRAKHLSVIMITGTL